MNWWCKILDHWYSPWNSAGQNTGVDRLSLSQEILPNPGIEPRSPALQADSLTAKPQGKPNNTGVGSLSLLKLIFSTQESNWGLLHCRWIVYQLSHKGSPRILEWVAYPFSCRSSQPRNWTGVTCIGVTRIGGFFTKWALGEALTLKYINIKCANCWIFANY